MSNKRNVDSIYNNNNNNNNNNTQSKQKKTKANDDDDTDVLGSILKQMDNKQQGRAQLGNQTQRPTFSVENVMKKIIEMVNSGKSVEQLEVEGRVGLLINDSHSFRPGMIQEDWETLLQYLRSTSQGEEVVTTERDYIYDGFRIVYDDEKKQCLRKDIKTEKSNFDQPSSLIYDLRLSVSFEETLPPPISPPQGYTKIRDKERYSFHDKYWKTELTRIISRNEHVIQGNTMQFQLQQQTHQTIEHIFEVELELNPQAIRACVGKDSLGDLLNRFIDEIKNLIIVIQPPSFLSFPDLNLEKVNFNEIDPLKSLVFKYLHRANPSKFDQFPGSMPVNFGKKQFYRVQTNEYYVSEKTDGIRYMLLIYGSASYFIDRKFEFYYIKDFPRLAEQFGNGMLLDGEMIRHHQTKKPVYLIFDIIASSDRSLIDKSLTERLSCIGQEVVAPIRSFMDANPEVESSAPFSLLGKTFYRKSKINDLFACIKDYHGERFYIDKRRHHMTDGIILTPDSPYEPYTVKTLFKWKYLDKWTIDFKVRGTHKGWFLSCIGNGNVEVDCREACFSEQDIDKLRKEMMRARDQNAIIAECSFQPKYGTWKFHQIRHDKKKGNYITIVMDTMESIAENLTPEELKYRIPIRPDQDLWEEELQKLRQSLLHRTSSSSSSSSQQPY